MVHLLCEELQALATAGAGHGGEGISGFIICLNPAAFAKHEVQSPCCSCRQGMVAGLCCWHVPTGTLKVCFNLEGDNKCEMNVKSSLYSCCRKLLLSLTHTHISMLRVTLPT